MARPGQADVYETNVQPYIAQISEWYQTMTLQQIAQKLGINKSTLCRYRNQHPELDKALTIGRSQLVEELRSALKRRALGYDYVEVKQEKAVDEDTGMLVVIKETTTTKHVPPDLGSAHVLLKNLDPNWHDADMITIKQRAQDLKIKQQKADSAEW